MNCQKCGSYMNDNQAFCPNCGNANANANQQPQYQQPQYQQAQYQQPQYQQPQYQPPYQPNNGSQLPMNWFKFLIYFALFASGVLNIISGITAMTGSQYGGLQGLVYMYFGGLQALDIIYGICCIALGAFAIYVRMRLAGYYKNGPQMLNVLYIAAVALSLIYVIGVSIVVGGDVPLNFASTIVSAGVSVAMVVANTVYFKKRAHLFTK